MLAMSRLNFVKCWVKWMTRPKFINPGWNPTMFLTIGGFSIMAISLLIAQFGYGSPDPVAIEIGKAAFYTGISRAYTQAENEQNVKRGKEIETVG